MTTDDGKTKERSLLRQLATAEQAAPPWPVYAPLLLLAVMLLCLALVGPTLASILLNSQSATPQLLTLGWTIGMTFAAGFAFINRRGSQASRAALRFVPGELPTPLVMLTGVAIALGINLFVSLGGGRFLPLAEIYGASGTGIIVAGLLLLIAQPLAETLVFQATLLPSLRYSLGPRLGLLAAGALYALLYWLVFHAPYQTLYHPLWHGLLQPFLLCLSFSALRVATRSSRATLIARVCAGAVFLLAGLTLTL